jgi:hypothetical protein
MGKRHAGGEHQRGNTRPICIVQVRGGDAGAGRFGDDIGVIIPPDHVSAAGKKRARACQPGASESEHGNSCAGKGSDADHWTCRFNPQLTAA